jgi:hypothetical protein
VQPAPGANARGHAWGSYRPTLASCGDTACALGGHYLRPFVTALKRMRERAAV